jgi:ATP-dependent DNA helicase RecG
MSETPKSKKAAPLELPVSYLRGVGPRKASAFKMVGVHTLRDLLYYVPRRYLDRSTSTKIGSLRGETKDEVTIIGRITETQMTRGHKGSTRYEAALEDDTGTMTLIWFRQTNRIRKWIKEGYTAAFSGKVTNFGGTLQMAHPETMTLSRGEMEDLRDGKGRWVALYPGGKEFEKVDLDVRGLRTLMDRVVGEYVHSLPEMWPDEILKQYGLPTLGKAMMMVHRPRSAEERDLGWKRMKFDELVIFQLLWAWTRRRNREQVKGIAYPEVGGLTRSLIEEKLPFKLTDAQKRVMREIWNDMKQPFPMTRLLQGDVGSGKTVIALIAMCIAVENGHQAALMAPTEILADQHFLTSRKFLDDLNIHVDVLTGGLTEKARREKYEQLAQGQPGIIIGTHALIQDKVQLPNLGLTIIDEQHRFGVAQRLKLMEPDHAKGKDLDGSNLSRPDVLVMTATPIPRSLALTLYGDLDVSRLDEMPPGRGKVTTKQINADFERRKVYEKLAKKVEAGGRAYVIFPLVEQSEKLDLAAATSGYEELSQGVFRDFSVGLLHGRMPVAEKAEAMRKFAAGEIQVLVSTTVVEVGVDVPEATIMVIEHAERFGLSQLHQLRGRIGRGGRNGYCALFFYPPVGRNATARLSIMESTTDGFMIAEEDLRIRGMGDFFGTKQSGLPPLRFSDIVEDQDLVLITRKVADDLLNKSPDLSEFPELNKEFHRSALGRVNWLEAG